LPRMTANVPRVTRDPRKTRRAIAEALLSLLRDGGPLPTADTIAAQARVSRRSVFVHFPNLDALYVEAGRIQAERLRAAAERIDPALPLGERIDRFVAQRERVYEVMTPVRRVALGAAPASAVLSRLLDDADSRMRAEVAAVFAVELTGRPPHAVDAIDAAVSWASWYHLRRLGPAGARRCFVLLLHALLRQDVPLGQEMIAPGVQ
jgi:AcrR family transcriptional regulator